MSSSSPLRKAVFLDRDGTINEECDYLFRSEDCRFIPGAAEAIRRLNAAGFQVIVVTNQSGVARGFYGVDDIVSLHAWITEQLAAAGARIDAWYYCPHHPEYGGDNDCNCRKPFPGMLLQAAAEHGIDLASSWMVGDKVADIEAGIAAGCRPLLVRTGYGARHETKVSSDVVVVDALPDAAGYILANTQFRGDLT
jgi:D-glycero-D-manno-heptose 1,7-bisphosphate phosphatase